MRSLDKLRTNGFGQQVALLRGIAERLPSAPTRLRRRIENLDEARRRVPWPEVRQTRSDQPTVGIVAVNFNTATHISQLVFSLHRVLAPGEFTALVVVDNGSTDDSPGLLAALEEAGLLCLLSNRRRPYHGPGLNRGISFLAGHRDDPRWRVDYVCVLDSDVVVLKPDTISAAVAALRSTHSVLAGEFRLMAAGARNEFANVHAVVLDPRVVCRRPIPPFQEHPLPGKKIQEALRRRGYSVLDFPFCREEYVLHLGHSTVRELEDERHKGHRYRGSIALDLHFEGNQRGPERYLQFNEVFLSEVSSRAPEALVAACLRPERLLLT